MSRTTTDPKPHLLALRIGPGDMATLKRLAKETDSSVSEVIRALIRSVSKKTPAKTTTKPRR